MVPPQQRYDVGHTLRKMVSGQEGVRGKTFEFPARRRIGMLVAHTMTEKKQAHVAHTQLRNSDPLPDGAFETEGRGSLDLRGDSKHIVDRVNSDSKFSGKPQGRHNEYPRTSTFFVAEWESRIFGGSWQLDERRLQGSQHSKRSRMEKRRVDRQRPRPQSAQRWLRLWCVDHRSRQEQAVPTVQVFRFVECTVFYLSRNQRCEVLHILLDKTIGVRRVQLLLHGTVF